MKRILLFICFLLMLVALSFAPSFGQANAYLGTTTTTMITRGAMTIDTTFKLPSKDTTFPAWLATSSKKGALTFKSSDSILYYYTGAKWKALSTTSGGTGDVVGPASAVNNNIAVFDGTTGKLIKDGGTAIAGLQPIDATLTALAGLATGANYFPYSTGTDAFSQLPLTSALNEVNVQALNGLGSTIKGQNVGMTNAMTFTTGSMTSGRVYWQAMYVAMDCTITGFRWGQTTQGNYTSTAYNGGGLYSYSAGTMTQIAASTDDGAIWKATASTMASKAFSAPVAVTRGVYYLAVTYNQSAQTTAPALNALTTVQWLCNGDLTNSAKLWGTTTATSLPSPTQNISGVTAASTAFYFQLY